MVSSTGAAAPTSTPAAAGPSMLPVTPAGESAGAATPSTPSALNAFLALFADMLEQPAATPKVPAPVPATALPATTLPGTDVLAEPLVEDVLGGEDASLDDDDGDDDAGLLLEEILAAAAAVTPPAVPMTPPSGDVADAAGSPVVEDVLSKGGRSAVRGQVLPFVPPTIEAVEVAVPAPTATADLTGAIDDLVANVVQGSSRAAATSAADDASPATGPSFALHANGVSHANAQVQDASAIVRTIYTPVGQAAWADELGAKVSLLAHGGTQSASLRLSPEHLGPLEVRIEMTDDGTSVYFGAQQADTRAALNDALPRLRELFAAQGMMLADAGVSREAPRQQSAPQPDPTRTNDAGVEDSTLVPVSVTRVTRGLIDTYA